MASCADCTLSKRLVGLPGVPEPVVVMGSTLPAHLAHGSSQVTWSGLIRVPRSIASTKSVAAHGVVDGTVGLGTADLRYSREMTRRHSTHSRITRLLVPLAAFSLVAAACDDDDDAIDVVDTTDATDTTDAMTDETIVDIAVGNPDLSTLVAALEAAELVETLSGEGPYTVFAPTNDAFDTAVGDLGVELDDFLTDVGLLEGVLLTHVIEGETIMSSDIEDGTTVTAMSDTELGFTVADGTVTVEGIDVTSADIEASNGVIHVIDGVLFPAD